MDNLKILVLAGTTRKQRQSIKAAKFIEEYGNSIEGVDVTLVDPSELKLPGDGNDPEAKDEAYTKLTAQADGFFIVTPEYNHAYPGSLKRMLDSELKNYIHKPVAIAGVSSGSWGGVRAVQALVPVLRELGMVATFTDVYFPKISEIFDEDGNLLNEYYNKSVKKAYDELIWMAKVLKRGRDEEK